MVDAVLKFQRPAVTAHAPKVLLYDEGRTFYLCKSWNRIFEAALRGRVCAYWRCRVDVEREIVQLIEPVEGLGW